MSNKRLETLLLNRGGQLEDKDLLDCYNQSFARDIAFTIITRISAASHYYVIEIKNTPSD